MRLGNCLPVDALLMPYFDISEAKLGPSYPGFQLACKCIKQFPFICTEWRYEVPCVLVPRPAVRAAPCVVQVFRGVWRIQEGRRGEDTSRLSYALFVRPQIWLPVRLVQGRIEQEIKNNLAAVRQHTEALYSREKIGKR